MRIEDLTQLLNGSAESVRLLEAAASCSEFDAAAIGHLRKIAGAELVGAAIDLTIARRKAADKFDRAAELALDPEGVEQATSGDVAAHKAARFAQLGADCVMDLCCGVGGDAMGLAAITDVLAVDADPARAWMTRFNVERVTGRACETIAADVTSMKLPRGAPFHIDPSRREAGRRIWRYEDCLPGPAFIKSLINRCADGAVKLSPGVDFAKLPRGEVEIISRGGSLVQAVLWTGRLAHHPRTATRLPVSVSLSGSPAAPPITPAGRYLLSVDPAIERAGLMGLLAKQIDCPAIHPALGLLTSDEPVNSPWLTAFEVIESMPWRLKKVKAALNAHGASIVEVKTRGKAVDPDIVQKQLRGEGDQPLVVFILRDEQKITAWITRRIA